MEENKRVLLIIDLDNDLVESIDAICTDGQTREEYIVDILTQEVEERSARESR